MIKKYDMQMTFPVELMYKHISNREAFEMLDTPFAEYHGYTCCKKEDADNPIYKSVEKYKSKRIEVASSFSLGGLSCLSHVMDKEIEHAYLNDETNEDIFGGWGGERL